MFVDEVKVEVIAGRGGDGMVAFRREKFVPRGGPAGGDGGHGGSVILRASSQLNTLFDFRHRRVLKATSGQPGRTKNQTGADGDDLVVDVPAGTLIFDVQTDELIGDLVEDGQTLVVAEGGRGGRGNARFVSSTNRAPRKAESGREGQRCEVRLELKLLADVGLMGYPSVGKSTLIAAISSARPKIADYHFTTLVPNLGVVSWREHRTFVVADIPGLIEGASEGKGLGHQFLRHVERTRVLVHVLEVTPQLEGHEDEREPIADFERLNAELESFNPELVDRPQVVVLNKIDLPFVQAEEARLREHFEGAGHAFFAISAATRTGVGALVDALGERVSSALERAAEADVGGPGIA